MNITVNYKVTHNRLPEIAARFPSQTSAAVRKAAFDIQETAQNKAPVDTGYLAGTIWTDLSGDYSATVQPAAEYAGYVELGTYKMSAQPYMRPAAEAVGPQFEAAIAALMRMM